MGCIFSTTCDEPIKPTCDGFRETPLRLLGYATHLGNTCSTFIPPHLANVPQMITTAYILSDVFTKTMKSSEEGKPRSRIAIDTADAVIWQMLATVILPGLILNKIKQLTLKASAHPPNSCSPAPPLAKAFPAPIVRALPCVFGILAIPLIMYPIDKGVTMLMDLTYRSILKDPPSPEELKKKKPPAPKKPPKPVKVEVKA